MFLLPPATKLGQGYVFTRVCDSVHRGGVLFQHSLQVVSQHALQQGGCYPSIHCKWYPSMPCSRGVSSGGWPSVIAFCCGLLLWPSGLVA